MNDCPCPYCVVVRERDQARDALVLAYEAGYRAADGFLSLDDPELIEARDEALAKLFEEPIP